MRQSQFCYADRIIDRVSFISFREHAYEIPLNYFEANARSDDISHTRAGNEKWLGPMRKKYLSSFMPYKKMELIFPLIAMAVVVNVMRFKYHAETTWSWERMCLTDGTSVSIVCLPKNQPTVWMTGCVFMFIGVWPRYSWYCENESCLSLHERESRTPTNYGFDLFVGKIETTCTLDTLN